METQEKKNIPIHRFPEFQNEGEWEKDAFENTFLFLPNNTLSRAELNYENGSTKNVHYGDVLIRFSDFLDVQASVLPFISDEAIADKLQRSRLQDGDVVIADTAEDETVGKCTEIFNVSGENVVSGLHTIPVRPKKLFAIPYLGFYFNSDSYRKQLLPLMQGVKVMSISKTAIGKTIVAYPSLLSEQCKIGSCLSSMDEYISATKEKLELLKTYKQGLMQKLFPAKGKNMPKLRFKEFEKKGEWGEKSLGDCLAERLERGFIDLPLLSLTENDGIILQEETNRKNNSNIDKSKYLRVCIGDIAYNTMRMWQGRCAFVTIEGIVSPAYTICKPNEEMHSLFFYYLFKTSQAIELFRRYSQGLVNDTLNLKYESFATIKMVIPHPTEQHRIASCLTSIDEMINQYTNKVALLELYKKGLMQQMFPTSK